tara:strand:- start:294 stop:995 length:702 start_codon:yes stop_codon:yes gene_type:complete
MHQNKTFLAIIPARGGSKRLPRKNILDLSGRPMISWSIDAGLKSKYIDKVVVSSDDDEILDIAKKFKAETVKRPGKLASDIATSNDVVKHTLENIEEHDYIVLLQPTSPLRNYKHIDEAIKLLEKKSADAIISVCKTDHTPLWSNTLQEDGSLESFIKDEVIDKRSQDLKDYYRLNGAIYICKRDNFLKEETLFLKENIYAYIMDKESSIDIDEEIDLTIANVLASSIVDKDS